MPRSMKGIPGKNTGPSARRAIRAARKRGLTTKQIARAARRSTSVINAIENNVIANPPAEVARRIRKL